MIKTHYYTGDKNHISDYKKGVFSDVLRMSINLPNDIFKYKNYNKILYIKKGYIIKKDILFNKYEKKTI